MRTYIGIDPGMSGGIAIATGNGYIIEDMPPTIYDLKELLLPHIWKAGKPSIVIVEKVGGYMPGNSGPAAVKFARHCGQIDGMLCGLSASVKYITPSKWMQAFLGTVPKNKKDRKNAIKLKAQQLLPKHKITLKTADAIGILISQIGDIT